MIHVSLSRGLVAMVDDEDESIVLGRKWHAAPASQSTINYYATTGRRHGDIGPTTVYMHRLIMDAQAGQLIDHIDGNGLNNTRANLRIANHSINNVNRYYRSAASGFRGVHQVRHKWRAQIVVSGVRFNGKCHERPEVAAMEYDRMALEAFGDAARLNFPEMEPRYTITPAGRAMLEAKK